MAKRQHIYMFAAVFALVFGLGPLLQLLHAQDQEKEVAYLLRGRTGQFEIPTELESMTTRVVRAVPEPPIGERQVRLNVAVREELAVPKALQMTEEDRDRLRKRNTENPILQRRYIKRGSAPVCGNHEAIGTVVPGTPLGFLDKAGTWASMAIVDDGIDGLSGWVFTPMSNIAAQTLEVLGAYGNNKLAELSVFDWSCVDNKAGIPPCSANTAWGYIKPLKDIPSHYKFYYWDGCNWQKALALANMSRPIVTPLDLPAPFGSEKLNLILYVNQAKILNWKTLQWELFYARLFLNRDAKPPRPWGPTAFVEFISNSGCPSIPRLGFREVRFQNQSGIWQLAVPSNSSMRFDLPSHYRYGLLDPNHTWCVVPKE